MKDLPVRLIVSGCCGRMGRLIVEEASHEKDLSLFQVVGGVEAAGHAQLGQNLPGIIGSARITSVLDEILRAGNLIVEFTTPEVTLAHAETAAKAGVPMLIGTTGFRAEQLEQLKSLAHKIALFWSPNMSIGIVVVRRTLHAISKLLAHLYPNERIPVSISEVHHAQKIDKPSGTARALAQEVSKAANWLIRDEEIEARRQGDVVGIHAVTFNCPSENITLRHEATDRRVFAQGALRIAKNFHRVFRRPGWYEMDDFIDALQRT